MNSELNDLTNNKISLENNRKTDLKFHDMKNMQNKQIRLNSIDEKYCEKNREKDELDYLINNQKEKHKKESSEMN